MRKSPKNIETIRSAWAYVTKQQGRVTVRTLAAHLKCSRGTANKVLHNLCDAGYVEHCGSSVWRVVVPLI